MLLKSKRDRELVIHAWHVEKVSGKIDKAKKVIKESKYGTAQAMDGVAGKILKKKRDVVHKTRYELPPGFA